MTATAVSAAEAPAVASAAGDGRPTLQALQVLRGVAAMLVVLHHSVRAFTVYRPDTSKLPLPQLFGAPFWQTFSAIGVDIFFVISGFIMIYVSRSGRGSFRGSVDFLVRRLIRIYPMYFLFTAFLTLLNVFYVVVKGSAPSFDLNLDRIVGAVLFIPTFDEHGAVSPVLGVGWTLYYEMFFYISFAVAMWLSPRRTALALSVFLVSVILLARLSDALNPTLIFLKNPLMLEFVFGCAMGELFFWKRDLFRIHPAILIGAGMAGIALHPDFPSTWRFLVWGVPSALIVWGVLAMDVRSTRPWSSGWLTFGDASYVIYLVHMIVIYNFVNRLVLKIPTAIDSGLATDGTILACIGLSLASAVAVHLWVEQPIRARLMSWIRRPRLRVA